MANKYRGEVEITLLDKSYTLRPTFEALVEFEDKAGISAFEAMRDLAERQRAPIKVITAALHSGIKAGWPVDGGRPPSFAEVGHMIQRQGVPQCLLLTAKFLTNALASDKDLEQREADEEASGKG